MTYAATRASVKRQLGSANFSTEIFGTVTVSGHLLVFSLRSLIPLSPLFHYLSLYLYIGIY
jgi:hypothetical protein